jgi:hypothetical protein
VSRSQRCILIVVCVLLVSPYIHSNARGIWLYASSKVSEHVLGQFCEEPYAFLDGRRMVVVSYFPLWNSTNTMETIKLMYAHTWGVEGEDFFILAFLIIILEMNPTIRFF